MCDESSEARKSAQLATSSGWPIRPIGTCAIIASIIAGLSRATSIMLVSMGPGWMELQRIFALPYWTAVALVSSRTAPLELV